MQSSLGWTRKDPIWRIDLKAPRRDFVATAPACGVPVESKIVDTTTGFAACDFTQSIGAELLVVPAPEHVEGAVPSMMDWALQVIPCSLWIVRES